MATIQRYERRELERNRDEIERRHTLQDLRDIALMRDLTGEEYQDMVELQRIEFLLGDTSASE